MPVPADNCISVKEFNKISKYKGSNKFTVLQEKIYHQIKLFVKNEKELDTLIQTIRIYSQNIGMEFGIENWTMLVIKGGERQKREAIELRIKKE